MMRETSITIRRGLGILLLALALAVMSAGDRPAGEGVGRTVDPRRVQGQPAEAALAKPAPPVGDMPSSASARVRVGMVDLVPSDPPDDRLEELALHERWVDAFEHAVRSLRARAEERGPFDTATLLALHRVGTVAHFAGDSRTAQEVLEAALDARRKVLSPDDPRLAETLVRLGVRVRYSGDRARARSCFDEAARILDGAGPRWEPLRARLEHAEADWIRQADPQAAVVLYRRALDRRRRCLESPSYPIAANLTWMAWTASQARLEGARGWLLEADAELRGLGLHGTTLYGNTEHIFADWLALEGRSLEAESHYRTEATILENARPHFLPGYPRNACRINNASWALAALHQGRFEEAWTLFERGRAATQVDQAVLGQWRDRSPEGFRALRALRLDLLEVKRRLALARRQGSSWSRTTWRLLLRTLALRADIARKEADYLRLHRPMEPTLSEVRELLGPSRALVGWLVASHFLDDSRRNPYRWEVWGYVVRESEPLVWKRLEVGRSSSGPQRRSPWEGLDRAARWPLRVESDPETNALLRSWTVRYLDPLLPALDGVEHLIVESMWPIDTYIDGSGRFIGDRFDVTYVPSALHAVLAAGTARPRRVRESLSALAIAGLSAPVRTTDPSSLASIVEDSNALRVLRTTYPSKDNPLDRLPRLPFAGLEAELVARRFSQAMLFEGGTGIEGRLRDVSRNGRLAGFDVVHIATHSLTDGFPERCGLALGSHAADPRDQDDEVLDFEEIGLGWNVNARLITLSGCETANIDGHSRDDGAGLTSILLASGARQVLASIWPVDDRATTILMDRFYRNLTGRDERGRAIKGLEPMRSERALREAKAYLRGITDGQGRHPYAHPAYWGGFSLTGIGEVEPPTPPPGQG